MPPSLTWAHWGADGGDLAVAVVRGRLPHPPGFPAYLLLGKLFIRIPWGEPAWRLNLMSAVMGAGAAAICALAWQGEMVFLAGLSLGLAPLFWSQAIITEVYVPAAFFSSLLLLLIQLKAPAWLLGAIWGLGVGFHPSLILLAPVTSSAISQRKGAIQAIISFLVVSGMLYGPFLLAQGANLSPWADLSTFSGWWGYVSARLYHGYLFSLPLTFWPKRLLAWVALVSRQFTPLGAILALWGFLNLWRQSRPLALATASAFGAFSLLAIGYNTPDSSVYLVPALPLATFWLSLGLSELSPKMGKWRWLLAAIPLIQAILFWGSVSLSNDLTAMEWAKSVLNGAPPNAILLTSTDQHTFTLWYAQEVLGKRPDLTVIDRDLWWHEPYRKIVLKELGLAESGLDLEETLARTGRPILEVK